MYKGFFKKKIQLARVYFLNKKDPCLSKFGQKYIFS